jgi:hypothetical protein
MTDEELRLHRHHLTMRSALLRVQWRDEVRVIHRPLAVVQHAQHGVQWLLRNPQWVLGGAVVLGVLRPRRVLAWAGRLWWGWNLYNRARQFLATSP